MACEVFQWLNTHGFRGVQNFTDPFVDSGSWLTRQIANRKFNFSPSPRVHLSTSTRFATKASLHTRINLLSGDLKVAFHLVVEFHTNIDIVTCVCHFRDSNFHSRPGHYPSPLISVIGYHPAWFTEFALTKSIPEDQP